MHNPMKKSSSGLGQFGSAFVSMSMFLAQLQDSGFGFRLLDGPGCTPMDSMFQVLQDMLGEEDGST